MQQEFNKADPIIVFVFSCVVSIIFSIDRSPTLKILLPISFTKFLIVTTFVASPSSGGFNKKGREVRLMFSFDLVYFFAFP